MLALIKNFEYWEMLRRFNNYTWWLYNEHHDYDSNALLQFLSLTGELVPISRLQRELLSVRHQGQCSVRHPHTSFVSMNILRLKLPNWKQLMETGSFEESCSVSQTSFFKPAPGLVCLYRRWKRLFVFHFAQNPGYNQIKGCSNYYIHSHYVN